MRAKIVDWKGGKLMQENEIDAVILDPHDLCSKFELYIYYLNIWMRFNA